MRKSNLVVSRSFTWLVAVASAALALSVVTRAALPATHQAVPSAPAQAAPTGPAQTASMDPAQTAPMDDETLDKQGEKTTERVCTECHPFDDIIVERRTVKGWKDVLTTMTNKGAQGTEQQLTLIRRYLTRFFGLVGINSASADDLAAVLGLTTKEAAAIVEYRTGHGKFADAAALEKVPGLDAQKIKDQLDAIKFD